MRGSVAILDLLTLTSAVAAQTPGIWLTGLAPNATDGWVTSISQTGGTAAGFCFGISTSSPFYGPGFTWTRQAGRYDFGLEPGLPATTNVYGIDSDGGVLAGYMRNVSQPQRAFRRAGSGPLEDLGVLSNETRSYARGISGDGSIVIGASEHSNSTEAFGQAFRWTAQTGMVGLGYTRPGGGFSQARGISRDGDTIVGHSQSGGPGGPDDAFVWTLAGGIHALPGLPGAPAEAQANAVSANGAVVVGVATAGTTQLHSQAIRWVEGLITDLGTLPGFVDSVAFATSDDGNVIGGSANASSTFAAFVWTSSAGMLPLSSYLNAAGVTVPAGYRLDSVFAISGDGLSFAGQARNLTTGTAEGFVATVPPPASFLVLLLPAIARRKRPAA